MLFSFFLDFFLFLGIYLHYIQPLEIEVYYNVLFADNQNGIYYLIATLILGYLIMYVKNSIKIPLIMLMFALSFATLLPSVGKHVGERLFMRKNVTLHNQKFTFNGDILYNGRTKVTFYDYDLQKTILLNKNDILENVDEFY